MVVASDICKRCAERFGSCCKSNNPERELFFPVFPKDVELVGKFTGKEVGIAETANSLEFQQAMISYFPKDKEKVKELFPLGSTHFCFKIDSEGNCHYLGAEGCILPLELRPLYCHIFPFWVNENQVTYFYREECLATRHSSDLNLLMKYFETDEEKILELFKNIRKEWGLD